MICLFFRPGSKRVTLKHHVCIYCHYVATNTLQELTDEGLETIIHLQFIYGLKPNAQ